jgi:CHAT domain-containing protein
LGEYAVALVFLDSALTMARRMNVVHYVAWCYQGIGSVYYNNEQYDNALVYYDSALVTFEGYGYRNGQAMMLDHLGQGYASTGDLERAVDYYKRSIEIRESVRRKFEKEEMMRSYVEVQKGIYERLAILLIMLGKYEEAFDYIERSRSERLRRSFELSEIVAFDPSLRRILERITSLTTEIDGLRSRFQKNAIAETLFVKQMDALEGRLNQATLDLKIHHPRLYNVIVPQTWVLEDVQDIIPDSTLFISFTQTDEAYAMMLFTQDLYLFETSGLSKDSVDQMVMQVLRSIRRHEAEELIHEQLAELYQVLLKPFEHEIEKYPNIVIIPYGVLHYLPFHVLCCGDEQGGVEYLLALKRISYLPSASFLADLMHEPHEAPNELLAFGNADGTLPSAEMEVELIARLFDRSFVCKCDSASKDRFIQLSNEFRLIHLATHGILASDPRFSHIVLAPALEGNLTVREIFGLSGHFEKTSVVTLSACETAVEADPEAAGMELVTLSNAFKVAGVPTTIASLWEIADQSTAVLMENFYKNLRGGRMDKLESLRQAQISMINHDQYAHPYYWAPFALFGNWR